MPEEVKDTKQELRQLIAGGRVREALTQLLELTQADPNGPLHREVILLSSKQEKHEREQRLGSVDYDDLARTRIQLETALLDLVAELPEGTLSTDGVVKPKRESGLPERALKSHLLWIMLGIKLVVILFLFTQWQAGGFTNDQFISILSLLIPVFATYTTLMFKDAVQQRHVAAPVLREPRVTRSFQWTAYTVMALYLIMLLVVIGMRPQGVLSFQQLTGLLAIVETALGVYVGQIVFALFKKEEL